MDSGVTWLGIRRTSEIREAAFAAEIPIAFEALAGHGRTSGTDSNRPSACRPIWIATRLPGANLCPRAGRDHVDDVLVRRRLELARRRQRPVDGHVRRAADEQLLGREPRDDLVSGRA